MFEEITLERLQHQIKGLERTFHNFINDSYTLPTLDTLADLLAQKSRMSGQLERYIPEPSEVAKQLIQLKVSVSRRLEGIARFEVESLFDEFSNNLRSGEFFGLWNNKKKLDSLIDRYMLTKLGESKDYKSQYKELKRASKLIQSQKKLIKQRDKEISVLVADCTRKDNSVSEFKDRLSHRKQNFTVLVNEIFSKQDREIGKFAESLNKKLEAFNSKIENLSCLEINLQSICRENKILKDHIKSMQKDYSKLNKNLVSVKSMSNECAYIKQEYENLKISLKLKDKELSELKNQLESCRLNASNQQMTYKLSLDKQIYERIETLLHVNAELRSEIENKDQILSEQETRISSLQNSPISQKNVNYLQEEIRILRSKIKEYENEEEFKKLVAECEESRIAQKEVDKIRGEYEDSIQELTSQVKRLEKRKDKDRKTKTDLKTRIQTLESEKDEYAVSAKLALENVQKLNEEHREELAIFSECKPSHIQELHNEIEVLKDEISAQRKTINEKSAKIKELREIFGSKRNTVLSSKLQVSQREVEKSMAEKLDLGKGRVLMKKEDLLSLLEEYEKILSDCSSLLKLDDASSLFEALQQLKIEKDKAKKDLSDYVKTFQDLKHVLKAKHDDRNYLVSVVKTLKRNEKTDFHNSVKKFYNEISEKMHIFVCLAENKICKLENKIQKIYYQIDLNPELIEKSGSNPMHNLHRQIELLNSIVQEKENFLRKIKDLLGIQDDSTILVRIKQLVQPSGRSVTSPLYKNQHKFAF